MAHHTVRSAYTQLTERLNRFPQGAPASALLDGILRLLFSEREAALVSLLPIKPFTAATAGRTWKMPLSETQRLLADLADKQILLDIEQNGEMRYVLPPPMAGFFEFSLMRVRDDIDQRLLSELFYEYLNVEEDFIRALFTTGETQLGRVFVHEGCIPEEHALEVLDYERASEVVRTASHIGVGMCYCRHKMQHVGRACTAPMDVCMTFNSTAASLTRHGAARQVSASEGLDVLAQSRECGLVQFGENVQRRVNFICNCCGCCCEAMIAARRFGLLHPVHTTNYLPDINTAACNGCGKCVTACPVEAMGLVSANDPQRPRRKAARLETNTCLGCGVCVQACTRDALRLLPRPARVITPVNSTHKVIAMAIERGRLQDVLFDNRALFSHRAMAAVLGVILKLPPVKQVLATDQVKSRYLGALLDREH